MSSYTSARAWTTQDPGDTLGDRWIQLIGAIILVFVVFMQVAGIRPYSQYLCESVQYAASFTQTDPASWDQMASNKVAYFSETEPILMTVPQSGSVAGFDYYTNESVHMTTGSLYSRNFVVTCP